ncbi:MAG TPA: ABC transporter ATP-binding protein [Burkholderiaceae bacterium]|nr:ABC transporter ATP-binding protein [Burkholderiaceae bacterium]
MTLLQVRGLTKRFGGLVATDALDLDVEAGQIHAVIGPNGAGKTTLISQLSGALAPDAGSIVLAGEDITGLSVHERVQRGIARSYQVTNVFRALSALENVRLAVQAGDGSSFDFWRPVHQERHLYERARELLQRVGLKERGDVPGGALAHGEQRQLEVALALATKPRLLLLDEPMAGMGPEESARMVALIEGLRGGLTIILIEHDMDAVFRLADRISVLVYGRVLATGTADAVRADPVVRQAYLGTETA